MHWTHFQLCNLSGHHENPIWPPLNLCFYIYLIKTNIECFSFASIMHVIVPKYVAYLLRLLASQDAYVTSRTSDLQDVLSCVAVTASLRDIWVFLTVWSAQRSGGRPLGRRHGEGGVEARMSMA